MAKKTSSNLLSAVAGKMGMEGVEFSAQDLISYPVEELTDSEVHFAWSVLDLLEKTASTRKKELRERLLRVAEEKGSLSEKGSFILEFDSGSVTKQKRQAKEIIKEMDLRRLLVEKGISPRRVFVEKIVEEFDEKEFKKLVNEELITREEVEQIVKPGKITWALKVIKPEYLPKALKGKDVAKK